MNDASPPDAFGNIRSAADALLGAMRAGRRLPRLPGATPCTIEEAYAIQNSIVEASGIVGGWKVSPMRPGVDPRCSPLPAALFHATPAKFDRDYLVACQAEVEIAVRLGHDLDAGDHIPSNDAVAAATDAIFPAVELAYSRFTDPDAPDLHRLADLQNCGGVVLGEAMRDWRGVQFSDLAPELERDGTIDRSPAEQPDTERALAAIGWLALHARQRGMPLRAGQIIITGARVGPLALGAARQISARVGLLGTVVIEPK